MDKTQAEAVKFQILERRNYLNSIDVPLTYSKRNLQGGMQNRVARKEDRNFSKKVKSQKKISNTNLSGINSYISELDAYNAYINRPIPISSSSFSIQSSDAPAPIISDPVPVVLRPVAPLIKVNTNSIKNKAAMVRKRNAGIKSRRYI